MAKKLVTECDCCKEIVSTTTQVRIGTVKVESCPTCTNKLLAAFHITQEPTATE